MTGPNERGEGSRRRLLPMIRRARGYRLYDQEGRRYLDLHLAGGRALLGHRPPRTLLELKNLISRGLLSELPSVYERRLVKALALLLPDYPVVRLFSNEERLLAVLGNVPSLRSGSVASTVETSGRKPRGRTSIEEPFSSPPEGTRFRRWRPFCSEHALPEGASALVPVLPFPGSFAPVAACVRGIADEELPPSDLVSPALLGSLTRSVYDLLRFSASYREESWVRFEAPWWRREGPYLVPVCEKGEYSEVFGRLLEGGILINPCYPGPSIVPAEYTEGELKPLRTLARQWGARS